MFKWLPEFEPQPIQCALTKEFIPNHFATGHKSENIIGLMYGQISVQESPNKLNGKMIRMVILWWSNGWSVATGWWID